MSKNSHESSVVFWGECLLGFILALIIATITIAGVIAQKKEKAILKDPRILENYRKFQEVGNAKRIAFLPNDEAKNLPEIKQILKERDHLLKQDYEGCTLQYYLSTWQSPRVAKSPQLATGAPVSTKEKDTPSPNFSSIVVYCHFHW